MESDVYSFMSENVHKHGPDRWIILHFFPLRVKSGITINVTWKCYGGWLIVSLSFFKSHENAEKHILWNSNQQLGYHNQWKKTGKVWDPLLYNVKTSTELQMGARAFSIVAMVKILALTRVYIDNVFANRDMDYDKGTGLPPPRGLSNFNWLVDE